jgi:hypothetical protein
VPKRSKPLKDDLDALAEDLARLLGGFREELKGDDLRSKVQALVPAFHKLRLLGCSLVDAGDASSARDRVLAYFRKYPFTVIEGDELLVVSGIQEYARRLRELRVQFGWWIYSGTTFKQMANEAAPEEIASLTKLLGVAPSKVKPDQYVLMREDEDREAAHRWHQMNSIRRMDIGVKAKLLEYFRQNVGVEIPGEELRYLAQDRKEWPRRARELRTEEGWPIATKFSGRPDLAMGVYVLEEDKQDEPHDRHIPEKVRIEVLERDCYSCTSCGWIAGNLIAGDRRKIIELHHEEHHVDKGKNVAENLTTLCNICHDDVHRRARANAKAKL